MNILEAITGAQNGAAVERLSAQFGLRPEQATSAVAALVPALAAGLRRNMSTDDGLAGLAAAVGSGRHERYLEDPTTLADPATTADGNAILGHVFGSKEVSRQVAAGASQKTGIDPSILKKMLPLVAAMAMAGLSRQSKAAGAPAADPRSAGAGFASMLEPMLDRDRDGSVIDDVMGMVGGMLGRRRG
jgi:hypothetical protein